LDIGKQRRVIQVEPEPLTIPTEPNQVLEPVPGQVPGPVPEPTVIPAA